MICFQVLRWSKSEDGGISYTLFQYSTLYYENSNKINGTVFSTWDQAGTTILFLLSMKGEPLLKIEKIKRNVLNEDLFCQINYWRECESVIIKIVSKVILTVQHLNFGFGGNRFFIVPPHITLHKLCIPLKLLGEKNLTHCNWVNAMERKCLYDKKLSSFHSKVIKGKGKRRPSD